jgi:hypothetical protein
LYPGAVIRVRAFLRAKEDLRPGRLTLTSTENERLHVEMANRGVLSINRTFLCDRVLYVVGQLRRLRPTLSVMAAAVLLAPLHEKPLPKAENGRCPLDHSRRAHETKGGLRREF